MVIALAASLPLGHSNCYSCYTDGLCCSESNGATSSWLRSPIDSSKTPDNSTIRYKNAYFGSAQFHWSTLGHDYSTWRVSVAADYSDSVPDSSSYSRHQYHPLEDIKVNRNVRETQLAPAEIARTTLEANNSALLVFPGTVHCEPHDQLSWAEFQYVIDDYGDIFFEIFDDNNLLQDPGASNPVNALIGMDIPMYENKRVANEDNVFDIGGIDEIPFDDEYFEVMDSEASDIPVDWGMPENSSWIHPIYFSKCLTKAIETEYDEKMSHPSNGVSIVGCLRPAFADEETYLRRLFHSDDTVGYSSDGKDVEILSFGSKSYGSNPSSTLYRLEIMRIELFSVYGIQSSIDLLDFQDAEPDVLVHPSSAILEHFREKEIRCKSALKALCKKKGLHVEAANLIGVDSLGIDVRIFTGVEVRTHRFPFKVRATCEGAARKQINQLLFPRSRRKKFRSDGDKIRDSKSY